jgi:phenylalanyl-tRNA synthetase beta chain
MKISEHWLREWVAPSLTTEQLVAQLTMAGLEVGAVAPAAAPFSGIVVGEVLAIGPHPNADRLRVCEVNAGAGAALTIVCGAANVRAGMKVPLARDGAVLPDGTRIGASKLRGVASAGMLCSARELGLAEQSDGLLEFPHDALPGMDVRRLLDLDDAILEIELTPNRGDCLSVVGIAREVAALNRLSLNLPRRVPAPVQHGATLPVQLDHPAACPRYLGRVVSGINPQAETPVWLRERLQRCGMRPINPVVDVTNYVLLELGQPMHAFDLSAIKGGITIRKARSGEALALLDSRTITLDDNDLVISDHERALALAGVMGGSGSAVHSASMDIFLECAFFMPEALAGCARRHGLHTESSHRFERGVDPALQREAMERATTLILDIAGGSAGPVIESVSEADLPVRRPITLRIERIERMLGLRMTAGEAADILGRLGMQVESTATTLHVTPPSYRFDISIENDLIEELARVHGYDHLPSRTLQSALTLPEQGDQKVWHEQIRACLVERGYQEALTYSFVDEAMQRLLHPDVDALRLLNPISSELGVMRLSLWSGLLKVACLNQSHRQGDLRMFEMGRRYIQGEDGLRQELVISGLLMGQVHPEQWGTPSRQADFYDLKADIEALLGLSGMGARFSFVSHTHPALHPGQSAEITLGAQSVGWAGLLNPQIAVHTDLKNNVYLFEVKVIYISERSEATIQALPRFPAIRRDVALIVDQTLPAEALTCAIRQQAGELLKEIVLFDVYQGKGIENGRKSMALGLIFQDYSRTLIDTEVDALVSNLLSGLHQTFNATLRT